MSVTYGKNIKTNEPNYAAIYDDMQKNSAKYYDAYKGSVAQYNREMKYVGFMASLDAYSIPEQYRQYANIYSDMRRNPNKYISQMGNSGYKSQLTRVKELFGIESETTGHLMNLMDKSVGGWSGIVQQTPELGGFYGYDPANADDALLASVDYAPTSFTAQYSQDKIQKKRDTGYAISSFSNIEESLVKSSPEIAAYLTQAYNTGAAKPVDYLAQLYQYDLSDPDDVLNKALGLMPKAFRYDNDVEDEARQSLGMLPLKAETYIKNSMELQIVYPDYSEKMQNYIDEKAEYDAAPWFSHWFADAPIAPEMPDIVARIKQYYDETDAGVTEGLKVRDYTTESGYVEDDSIKIDVPLLYTGEGRLPIDEKDYTPSAAALDVVDRITKYTEGWGSPLGPPKTAEYMWEGGGEILGSWREIVEFAKGRQTEDKQTEVIEQMKASGEYYKLERQYNEQQAQIKTDLTGEYSPEKYLNAIDNVDWLYQLGITYGEDEVKDITHNTFGLMNLASYDPTYVAFDASQTGEYDPVLMDLRQQLLAAGWKGERESENSKVQSLLEQSYFRMMHVQDVYNDTRMEMAKNSPSWLSAIFGGIEQGLRNEVYNIGSIGAGVGEIFSGDKTASRNIALAQQGQDILQRRRVAAGQGASEFTQTLYDVSTTGTEMGIAIAMGAPLGGVSAGAKGATGVWKTLLRKAILNPRLYPFAISALGRNLAQGELEGKGTAEKWVTATAQAYVESVLEQSIGFLSENKIARKLFSKGIKGLKYQTLKNFGFTLLDNTLGEAIEENLQDIANGAISHGVGMIMNKNYNPKAYGDIIDPTEMWKTTKTTVLIGFLMSIFGLPVGSIGATQKAETSFNSAVEAYQSGDMTAFEKHMGDMAENLGPALSQLKEGMEDGSLKKYADVAEAADNFAPALNDLYYAVQEAAGMRSLQQQGQDVPAWMITEADAKANEAIAHVRELKLGTRIQYNNLYDQVMNSYDLTKMATGKSFTADLIQQNGNTLLTDEQIKVLSNIEFVAQGNPYINIKFDMDTTVESLQKQADKYQEKTTATQAELKALKADVKGQLKDAYVASPAVGKAKHKGLVDAGTTKRMVSLQKTADKAGERLADRTAQLNAFNAQAGFRQMFEAAVPGEAVQAPVNEKIFVTSQGSVYTVKGNTTIRNKPPHKGHLPSDVGIKQQSDLTVYISPELSREIGMWGTSSSEGKRIVIKDGKVYLLSLNPKTGELGQDKTISDNLFSTEAKTGLSPLELWNEDSPGMYTKHHAGNEIVQVPVSTAQKIADLQAEKQTLIEQSQQKSKQTKSEIKKLRSSLARLENEHKALVADTELTAAKKTRLENDIAAVKQSIASIEAENNATAERRADKAASLEAEIKTAQERLEGAVNGYHKEFAQNADEAYDTQGWRKYDTPEITNGSDYWGVYKCTYQRQGLVEPDGSGNNQVYIRRIKIQESETGGENRTYESFVDNKAYVLRPGENQKHLFKTPEDYVIDLTDNDSWDKVRYMSDPRITQNAGEFREGTIVNGEYVRQVPSYIITKGSGTGAIGAKYGSYEKWLEAKKDHEQWMGGLQEKLNSLVAEQSGQPSIDTSDLDTLRTQLDTLSAEYSAIADKDNSGRINEIEKEIQNINNAITALEETQGGAEDGRVAEIDREIESLQAHVSPVVETTQENVQTPAAPQTMQGSPGAQAQNRSIPFEEQAEEITGEVPLTAIETERLEAAHIDIAQYREAVDKLKAAGKVKVSTKDMTLKEIATALENHALYLEGLAANAKDIKKPSISITGLLPNEIENIGRAFSEKKSAVENLRSIAKTIRARADAEIRAKQNKILDTLNRYKTDRKITREFKRIVDRFTALLDVKAKSISVKTRADLEFLKDYAQKTYTDNGLPIPYTLQKAYGRIDKMQINDLSVEDLDAIGTTLEVARKQDLIDRQEERTTRNMTVAETATDIQAGLPKKLRFDITSAIDTPRDAALSFGQTFMDSVVNNVLDGSITHGRNEMYIRENVLKPLENLIGKEHGKGQVGKQKNKIMEPTLGIEMYPYEILDRYAEARDIDGFDALVKQGYDPIKLQKFIKGFEKAYPKYFEAYKLGRMCFNYYQPLNNEVSRHTTGTDMVTELEANRNPDYFPLHKDGYYFQVPEGEAGGIGMHPSYSIARTGGGELKATSFLWAVHTYHQQANQYTSYAAAIYDSNRLLNTSTVREAFAQTRKDNTGTPAAQRYFRNFLFNMATGKGQINEADRKMSQIRSNVAGAKMSLSPTIPVKQLGAYLGGMMHINTRYLLNPFNTAKAIKTLATKQGRAEFYEKVPDMYERIEEGYMSIESGKLKGKARVVRAVDAFTVAASYYAAADQARAEGLAGADLDARASKLFHDVLWDTQQMYGVGFTAPIQQSETAKWFLMFASQQFQQKNMLRQSIKFIQQGNVKKGVRGILGVTLNCAVYAAIVAGVGKLFKVFPFDDDIDDGKEFLQEFAKSYLSSVAPIFSRVAGALLNEPLEIAGFNFEVADEYGVQSPVVEGFKKWIEAGTELSDSDKSIYGKVVDMAIPFSELFGIPAENAEKWTVKAAEAIFPDFDYEKLKKSEEGLEDYKPYNNQEPKRYYPNLKNAIASGNEEAAVTYIAQIIEQGGTLKKFLAAKTGGESFTPQQRAAAMRLWGQAGARAKK